jgi:nucleoside 2-deoxyribosyltransferase
MITHVSLDVDRIYLAGPIFSEAGQAWHRAAKARIEDELPLLRVVWPYELLDQSEILACRGCASRRVMEVCRCALEGCELVVALLDGPQVDDGTAWELGYAHARGIPSIGVRTDCRQAGDVPGALVNAMVHGSCEVIVRSTEELMVELAWRHRMKGMWA